MAKEISMEKFYSNSEKLTVIDVREVDEFESGHINGAQNIPLSELSNRLEEFNQDEAYYVICRSGRRSANACEILEEQNINVTNVEGGMLAWEETKNN